jgi:lipopolysaccharide export system protein LptA
MGPKHSNEREALSLWRLPVTAILLALALIAAVASAQTIGPVSKFNIVKFYDPPNETRIKAKLQGGVAIQLPDGGLSITNDFELQIFSTNALQLIVNSARCLYKEEEATRSARSPGQDPVRARTADGKYSLEGNGFLFQQSAEDSVLLVSNAVHTLIQRGLGGTNSAARGARSDLDAENVEIFSEQFSYSSRSGLGVYSNEVRIVRTNLHIGSGVLTLDLPTNAPLRGILAEKDVAVDYTNGVALHAVGQSARYWPDTDRIVMTGAPSWRAEQAQGNADELVVERTNQLFQAVGHGWLRLPGQSLGAFGSFASPGPASSRSAVSTNRWIDIYSDSYEFHTNQAVFRGHVRVAELVDNQARGGMTCALLTASFIGTNQLQQLVAQKDVVILQDTNQFTCGKAVYTPTNELLELAESPTWRSGRWQGKGDLIEVRTNEMLVSGHASARLPAVELEQLFSPGATNATAPRSNSLTNEFADIFCDEYVVGRDAAAFQGHVHAVHPQMDWFSGRLSLNSRATGAKIVVAEESVVFDLVNQAGQKVHGIGDRAFFTNWFTGTFTNSLVTLLGAPATLTLTNGILRNRIIIYDHATGNVSVPGAGYKVEVPTGSVNSNAFQLQKKKPMK